MNRAFLVAVLLSLCFASQGQMLAVNRSVQHRAYPPLALENSLKGFHENASSPRGLRQRNAGRALTIAGLSCGLAGVIVYTSARKAEVISGGMVTQEPEVGKMVAGLYLMEAGVGMLIPGVILWKKGQKKYTRYLEREGLISLNPNGSGLALRYSF